MKLRKVEVTNWETGEKREALFHQFGFESDEDSGFNVAIVENKDGTVEAVCLQYIRFFDALEENNNDIEIIIDPTPEQIPKGWMWGAHWDEEDDLSEASLFPRNAGSIKYGAWDHYAILVRGHLTPTEMVAHIRNMLAEKEAAE